MNNSPIISILEPLLKLKREGGICASQPALEKLTEKVKFVKEQVASNKLKDDLLWLNHTETRLLGMAISAQKVDSYDQSSVTHTVKDFWDSGSQNIMTFGVDIVSESCYITKSGPSEGMPRADLIVTDATGKMKVKVWADLYQHICSMLVPHNSIIITGKRGEGYYKDFLVANSIFQAN